MSASWITRGTVLVRLGHHHFAFFRGYLDGVDLRKLYERYIDRSADAFSTGSDLKAAKALLAWIIDQLASAARRYGHAPVVRILRMTPEKLGAMQASAVPDLVQFQEDRDPHQMYSEQELLDLFREEYGAATSGADRRAQRNRRLRARQAALLNQLEMQIARDPQLDDDVSGWLDPAIARRLNHVGIFTLKQLLDLIELYGFRWYTKVPRVGIKAARYVVEWLMLPRASGGLGVKLSVRSTRSRKHVDSTTLPPPMLVTDIVPIERFAIPAALNGAAGTNRGSGSSVCGITDHDAIRNWLARSPPGSNTARAYRKEAERLLLWSVLEIKKPLSSLTAKDCTNYRYFLAHLGRESETEWSSRFRLTQESWMGPRGIDRFSSRWRPFEGPLSTSSQKSAYVILHGMMAWMCQRNYLADNPFRKSGTPAVLLVPARETPIFTHSNWKVALEFLDGTQHGNQHHRLRFLLLAVYYTGCSLAELARLCRGDIVGPTNSQHPNIGAELLIRNSRGIVRHVALNPSMQLEIERYFLHRGYTSLAEVGFDAPLISAAAEGNQQPNGEVRLSANRLYAMVKSFFAVVADEFETTDSDLARTFRLATPRSIQRLSNVAINIETTARRKLIASAGEEGCDSNDTPNGLTVAAP